MISETATELASRGDLNVFWLAIGILFAVFIFEKFVDFFN